MGWLRNPRTTQERRANQDGYCRGRRSPHRLPSSWDDILVQTERSWKRTRKTQYKVKSIKVKKDSSRYAEHMSRRDHFWLNHKNCSWHRRRCNYCIKHGIWDEYEKQLRRRQRKYLEKRLLEELEWKRRHGYL